MFRSLFLPFILCLLIFVVTQYEVSTAVDGGGNPAWVILLIGFALFSVPLYKLVRGNDWKNLGRKHYWLPLIIFPTFVMSLFLTLQVLSLTGIEVLFPIGWALGCCVLILGYSWCRKKYGWDAALKRRG